MKIENCYLCGSTTFLKREGVVRDKLDLDILQCTECGLVFLSDREHIGIKHYEKSGMHGEILVSISEWLRETEVDDERRFQFVKNKIQNKKLLDFGCGVGGFLMKAREMASMALGIELEIRLQEFFQSQKLIVYKNLEELSKENIKFDIITAFHVVEHLPDPLQILSQLSNLLEKDGEIIIEVPNADDALLTLYKSKEFSHFTYWSQHLYLFNQANLLKLIKKAGFKLNWILQIQRYSLANHVHWLSVGKPGGHKSWSFLDSSELQNAYESRLASLGLCDTIILGASK